jgi:hypothetical protein
MTAFNICLVVRIAFKIHLRYDFVLSTAHLEVDMCRPHPQKTYYYAPYHGPQLADPYDPSADVLSPPDGVGYLAGGEPKRAG